MNNLSKCQWSDAYFKFMATFMDLSIHLFRYSFKNIDNYYVSDT